MTTGRAAALATIGALGDRRVEAQRVIFSGWDIADPTDVQVEARILAKVDIRELDSIRDTLTQAFVVDRITRFA